MADPSSGATAIIDAVSLETEVSKYVKLRPNKHELLGLCPFHTEDTPSFYVNPAKKLFFCFGCQTGGNVITFRSKIAGITTKDAVEALANDYGVKLEPSSSESRKPYYDNLDIATDFYKQMLSKSPQAKAYLNKRMLSDESINTFQIGYAPEGWRHLEHAPRFNTKVGKTLGLIIETDKGGYDRFRNRIIFPIISHQGKVVGFGGRSLGDEKPKYINSAESLVYHKSDILYGLYHALQHQEKTLIIVEGYLDVISLHAAGFVGACASLGTAFTPSHFKLAARYAEHIIFCFDGDEAGQKAQEKAFQTLLPHIRDQVSCSFLSLPKGEDPDSYLQKYGKEAFLSCLDSATPFSEYLLSHGRFNDNPSLEQAAKKHAHLSSLIKQMPDSILKNLLLDKLPVPIKKTAVVNKSPNIRNNNDMMLLELIFQQPEVLAKLPHDIVNMKTSLPPLVLNAWNALILDQNLSLATFLHMNNIHDYAMQPGQHTLNEQGLTKELSIQLINYHILAVDGQIQSYMGNQLNKEASESLQKLLQLKHLLKKKKIMLASCEHS